MKEKVLTIPELMLLAGTRVVLGVGVGLLLSGRLNRDQRRGAGLALLVVGVLSTIPIVRGILGKPALVDSASRLRALETWGSAEPLAR